MLVQSSPLAGFQFYAGKTMWDEMQVGDAIMLTREPDNAHDANAVRVEWRGRKLGYLPRAENRAVAAEMDRGGRVEARIARCIDIAILGSASWSRCMSCCSDTKEPSLPC